MFTLYIGSLTFGFNSDVYADWCSSIISLSKRTYCKQISERPWSLIYLLFLKNHYQRITKTSWLPLEKAMAPHSSTLAWKIPRTEKPGRLQSMGSLGVGHDRATSLSLFTFMHWRRKWQPTPVFLPGESQGQGSLVGCSLWGRTELDTTEAT